MSEVQSILNLQFSSAFKVYCLFYNEVRESVLGGNYNDIW